MVVVGRVVVVVVVVVVDVVVLAVVELVVVGRVVVVVPRVVVVVVVARVVVVVISGADDTLRFTVAWAPFQLPKQGVEALAATPTTVARIDVIDVGLYELLAVQVELPVAVLHVLVSLVPLLKSNLTVTVSGTPMVPTLFDRVTAARNRQLVLVAS